jgi:menaquinone-dependent protoporphyrinogen IX oxidase
MSENKKAVVIYRSKTGFTKNYAQWIAEELHCDLLDGKKASLKDFMQYDTIIYGAGLYASGISGLKLITRNYEALKNKKLIVFAVGASPVRAETTEALRIANLSEEQRERIHFYYLRGGFDYARLSPFYRFLMTLKKLQLKRIKNPDADVKGMLASYEHPLDFTKKANVAPIVRDVMTGQCQPMQAEVSV